MVRNLRKNDDSFSPKDYSKDIKNKVELLKKELSVNHSEQLLIKERMQTVQTYLKSLPSSDPQYGLFHAQIRMDQIELDELIQVEERLKKELDDSI